MKFTLDENRINTFYPDNNVEELRKFLDAFKEVCCGHSQDSPIAKLDAASRFRWLTATRSTIVQTSKVHPGFCDDPAAEIEKLHGQLVES